MKNIILFIILITCDVLRTIKSGHGMDLSLSLHISA